VGGREMGREAEERQDITAVATVLDYRIRLPCAAHTTPGLLFSYGYLATKRLCVCGNRSTATLGTMSFFNYCTRLSCPHLLHLILLSRTTRSNLSQSPPSSPPITPPPAAANNIGDNGPDARNQEIVRATRPSWLTSVPCARRFKNRDLRS
jgi:hypothetical protein